MGDLIMIHIEIDNLQVHMPDQLFCSETLLEKDKNLIKVITKKQK